MLKICRFLTAGDDDDDDDEEEWESDDAVERLVDTPALTALRSPVVGQKRNKHPVAAGGSRKASKTPKTANATDAEAEDEHAGKK